MPLFSTISPFTCFVVQPWLLSFSSFLIWQLIPSDSSGDLPIFGLSFSPSTPSLSYLFSQSEAQGLLLFISLTTRKGTCPSSITLMTRNSLSLTFGSFSFLYKLTNLALLVNGNDID